MITLIKKLSTITLIVFGMMSFQLQASYVMTELEATTLDVPDVSNTVDWDNTDTGYPNDDDKETVNIGFPFQFDNTIYTEVTILTNGILKFGAIERMHRDYSNEALATDEGDRFIAIYWDDLVDDAVASVTYGNLGTAPNRKFVVNWTNVKAYSNNLRYDFQVVLYENGDVRYRYNNNTSNGQSATIGLEIDDSDFIQYSFNSISVEVSFDLLFRNELLALPTPFLEYRLDELSWDGSPGEVIDSSTNSLSGRAFLGANTSDVDPALGTSIGTCNYGVFDGTEDYVEISNNGLLNFSSNFAIGVWIKIDSIPSSGLKTILSKDTNYEFHVNSSGQINWWWQTAGTNQTRTFNSTSSIIPGVWTHVVISFETGDQKIFINGIESGTATYPEDTTTNTNPLQFGSDQNSSSRYFNGNIDEINIFNQGLSSIQAQELMNKTRPCSSFNLCVSSFPDGLNSHTGGDINFEQDAQLFFSPDDVLHAGSVSLDGGSSQRSCVSVECQANGLAVEPTIPPSFPDTSINTINVSVNNNSTGDIGIGDNNYLNVSLGNNATLDVNAGYSDYSIDDLSIGNDGTLNLVAGTYWFNNFSAGQGLNITATGGTARIFINNSFTLPRDAVINSPSAGNNGDASQFLLYGYNDINAERDSTFSGVIYATGNVVLERSSNYYGAITGADISIGSDTNVFFNPTATAGLDYGDLCQAASCILGSFDITQPAYALACPGTRTQISIQAMCADGTSLKDDYSGTVDLSSTENTLSEFYASIASVSSINSTIFDGSELGQKDIYLFHQNENSALQIIASDSAIPILSTSSNATDFRTSGFALENPSAFTCGESTSMKLTAIGQDPSGASCQVLTGFTGAKAVKAWYSVNLGVGTEIVTTDLSVEGQLISDQMEPTANNINLTFNSGVADIPLAYANAGQILSVNIKHDDAPYDDSVPELLGVTLNATTTSFVVKPEQIELSISDASSECIAGDASCLKFVAAGSPFSINAEAQCVGGGLADDYQGVITFNHTLVAPLPGDSGSLSVNLATVTAADNGSIQISNQTISEVGVFDFIVQSGNYFTEVIPPFTLPSIGRFYPAYFQMSLASTSNACTNFSYMGQPGVTVDFTVQAHNTGGGQVSNYKDSFAKASMVLVAENDNDGGSYQARLINSSPAGGWINSQFDFTFTGSFSRSLVVDGPFQVMQIGALLSDNDDDVSALIGLDMKADTSSICGASCDAKRIGDIDVRFGQLKLSNVFGPETFNLDMSVQTEYFDGTSFIVNTDDSCTNLLVSNPPLVPRLLSWTDNLGVGETTPSLVSDIAAGLGIIQFSAAGLGNEGSVIFDYDVGGWLKTENTGDGNYTDNPFAKITFGQFRGTDRMIYWREVVRKAP
jgi:MSHA biogenesis protein MshQ